MIEKPPYASPCNGCGACCQNAVCPLGVHVMKIVNAQQRCQALRATEDGRFVCGLVVEPEAYAPVQAFIHGREPMSRAAAVLIGVGGGCDWQREDEPDRPDLRERMFRAAHTAREEKAADKAAEMWGVGHARRGARRNRL